MVGGPMAAPTPNHLLELLDLALRMDGLHLVEGIVDTIRWWPKASGYTLLNPPTSYSLVVPLTPILVPPFGLDGHQENASSFFGLWPLSEYLQLTCCNPWMGEHYFSLFMFVT
jgi:hypothetical protein